MPHARDKLEIAINSYQSYRKWLCQESDALTAKLYGYILASTNWFKGKALQRNPEEILSEHVGGNPDESTYLLTGRHTGLILLPQLLVGYYCATTDNIRSDTDTGRQLKPKAFPFLHESFPHVHSVMIRQIDDVFYKQEHAFLSGVISVQGVPEVILLLRH